MSATNETPGHPDNPPTLEEASSDDGAAASAGELQKRVSEIEAQLKEKDTKYLYLFAELENFKKRVMKERSELIKFGWENVARELLLVMDNFERAISHMPQDTDKNLSEGLRLIISQMRSALEKGGVQQIQAVGKEFNPELAEAVGQMPSEQPPGTVVREELKGYTLHGRLLRPANVIVSMGGQAEAAS